MQRRIPPGQIRNRLRFEERQEVTDEMKTAKMFVLERKHQKDITELLAYNEGEDAYAVARRLSIHRNTVVQWRQRLERMGVQIPRYKKGA